MLSKLENKEDMERVGRTEKKRVFGWLVFKEDRREQGNGRHFQIRPKKAKSRPQPDQEGGTLHAQHLQTP